MLVEISMVGNGPADALSSLEAWLRRDRELRREVVIQAAPGAPRGTMGAAEVIGMVLTHAEAIGGVLLAFAAWRTSRREKPEGIQVKSRDRIVVITQGTPAEIDRIVKELLSDEAG
jgi:uncharacterized membrane protein YfcA